MNVNRDAGGRRDPQGDRDSLERFVSDLARGQPTRRAPATLEARVLARLASHGTAWWHTGFIHWPAYVQAVFLLASIGFVRLALTGVMWLTDHLGDDGLAGAAMLHQGSQAVSTTVSVGDLLLHSIPPTWLYGAAAAGFVLYACLFGLGTVAYRTLYLQ